ncbi:MAG: hypothetical protein JWO73_657 [Candidatus Taylorbacteria bacterium]|nr:hypothetical protein [Candidatus Taylorbacteria bacterium]
MKTNHPSGRRITKFGRILMAAALLSCFSPAAKALTLLDTSFNPGTGAAGGFPETVTAHRHGKILGCGSFTSFNGINRSYVVLLNPDGSVDTNFLARPGYWVRHMAVQPDGKILIGGFFKDVNGISKRGIARLNFDGSLDTNFNIGGSGMTGTLAVSITGNPDPFISQIALQTNGCILITGNFTHYNGVNMNGIARLNPDGSWDPTFQVGSGLSTWGRSIQVLENGQILVTGWFDNYHNSQHNRMVLINTNGTPDNSFLPFFGDSTAVYTALKLANGQYIAAGHSLNTNGYFREEIRKLNPDGSVDMSFHGYANDKIQMVRLQSDGKILINGEFSQVDGVPRQRIARIYQDGSLDPSFNVNIDNWTWSTAIQPLDGKILVSGGFWNVDGASRAGIVRLNK